MNIPDGDTLLGLAEDLVRKAVGSGAEQAEVYLRQGASVEVDLEADRIAGASSDRSGGGAVRLLRAGRVGFAYFTDADQAPARIEDALRLARLAPQKGFRLPGPDPLPTMASRWDDDIALLDVDAAAARAKQIVAGAKQACAQARVAGGGSGASWHVEAIANSEGVAAWDRGTHLDAAASLVLDDGGRAVSAWDSEGVETGALDAGGVGSKVAETVKSLRAPRPARGGTADLILLPDPAAELVVGLVLSAVDGDRAKRGRSVWSDRLGDVVGHAGLRLRDDPLQAGALGVTPFDGEGLCVQSRPILADGVLRSFLFDSWTACLHGAATTHSAVRGGFKEPPSAGVHHVVLEHEQARPFDRLLADVDHGYLVESVLGAHTANATTGEFSVTAPNVWRIEKGAVAEPCAEVAVGGAITDLVQRLDAVSDAPRRRDGSVVPAIRLRDVSISV